MAYAESSDEDVSVIIIGYQRACSGGGVSYGSCVARSKTKQQLGKQEMCQEKPEKGYLCPRPITFGKPSIKLHLIISIFIFLLSDDYQTLMDYRSLKTWNGAEKQCAVNFRNASNSTQINIMKSWIRAHFSLDWFDRLSIRCIAQSWVFHLSIWTVGANRIFTPVF